MDKNAPAECPFDAVAALRPMDEPLLPSVFQHVPQLMTDFLRAALGKPDLQITRAASRPDLPSDLCDPSLAFAAEAIDADGKPYHVQVCSMVLHKVRHSTLGAIVGEEWWTRGTEGKEQAQCVLITVFDFDMAQEEELCLWLGLSAVDPPAFDMGPMPLVVYLYSGFDGTPPAGQERLGDWVHDLGTANPSDMRLPELAKRVWMLKLDRKRCEELIEENKTWEERITGGGPQD